MFEVIYKFLDIWHKQCKMNKSSTSLAIILFQENKANFYFEIEPLPRLIFADPFFRAPPSYFQQFRNHCTHLFRGSCC